MKCTRACLAALGVVALGAPLAGLVGCELVASVDRDEIPGDTTPTGTGGGGTGGSTGGGGVGGTAYSMSQFAEEDAYEAWTGSLPAAGAKPVTMGLDVVWQDVATRPLPFDLSVELDGVPDPLVQVFAIDDGPFARAGTRVEPLRPDEAYRVEISRTSAAAWARLVRNHDGRVVVSGPVVEVRSPSTARVTVRTARVAPRVRIAHLRTWREHGE